MKIAFCGHSGFIQNSCDERKALEILESKVKNEPCEFFLGEYGGFDSFHIAVQINLRAPTKTQS